MSLCSFSSRTWAAIGLLLLCFSMSGDSIDMDEAQTWDYARLGTFSEFSHELEGDPNSEAQMPLGMFAFWVWAKVFGTGEMAMRSINLLWAAVALTALAYTGKHLSIPWLPALFAIQPFVWYCMDQARTPTMQMAGGALILAGAQAYIHKDRGCGKPLAFFCLGTLVLCGASMLGVIPLAVVGGGVLVHGIRKRIRLQISEKILLGTTLVILMALGLYYGHTLLRGAGGAKIWNVSPANILFVGYEFLGFQGFGPGRQELRSIMKCLVSPQEILPFLPGIFALALSYIFVVATALKSWLTQNIATVSSAPKKADISDPMTIQTNDRSLLVTVWLLAGGIASISLLILFVLASLVGFPFWGRHLAGAFPFWVLTLAVTIRQASREPYKKSGHLAELGIILLLLVSSLLIRVAPWHKHDDYRGAAAEALRVSSLGRIVWWVADHSGATYYGLPLADTSTGTLGEIQFSMNRLDAGSPDAIILSRPDNFDIPGTASRMLASGSYKKSRSLQAFEIWEKRSDR